MRCKATAVIPAAGAHSTTKGYPMPRNDGILKLPVGAVRGSVYLSAAWTAADIAFEACVADDAGGTWVPVMTKAGARAIVDGPTAGNAYSLPPEVFDHVVVRPVSVNTGTGADENQAAERTLNFVFMDENL